jgi:hypothetical protein
MGCFDAELTVRFLRHRLNARRINPAIVEIEQCADGNR